MDARLTHESPPAAGLGAPALRVFRARLEGDVLAPGDVGYDMARKIWNGMIDRYPAVIARCASTADVVEAVRLAHRYDLAVAVRGGGHNVAGYAVCDGGLVIDLSAMKGLRVDADQRVAYAQPGLTWGEFDQATQAHGLGLTGGIHSTTGIAGFTLGGGFGWLARKVGLTCDNLLAAEVVTADGQIVRASARENADLLWGLRGGGGNFGIVTSFELRLHPLGPVLGGMLLYPLARAQAVLRFYREFAAGVPDDLFTIVGLMLAARAAHLPEAIQGTLVVAILLCFCGPAGDGEAALRPLRRFGPPAVDLVQVQPYTTLQTMVDAANPAGLQQYWKAEYVSGYTDQAIETLIDYAARKPSPLSKILIAHLGGAVGRVDPGDTAYAHRSAPFLVNINATWTDPQERDVHIGWARDLWTALQPASHGGVYVNFLSDEGEERVRAAYGAETFARLTDLKTRYDPGNFLRFNQNIQPRSAK